MNPKWTIIKSKENLPQLRQISFASFTTHMQNYLIMNYISFVFWENWPFESLARGFDLLYYGILPRPRSISKLQRYFTDRPEPTLPRIGLRYTMPELRHGSVDQMQSGSTPIKGLWTLNGLYFWNYLGTQIAMKTGTTITYSIDRRQDRGKFFFELNDPVYMGLVISNILVGTTLLWMWQIARTFKRAFFGSRLQGPNRSCH